MQRSIGRRAVRRHRMRLEHSWKRPLRSSPAMRQTLWAGSLCAPLRWSKAVVGGTRRRDFAKPAKLCRNPRPPSSESDLHVRLFLQMDAFDEAHLAGVFRHDDRRGAGAFAEEAHASHQRAFGHARSREDQLLARSEIFRGVDLVLVADSHAGDALVQFWFIDYQPTQHIAV